MCATLADVWKGGGPGALSPFTQVRVWALRDAYVDTGAKAHGLPVLIATKVTKVGGGRPEAEVVRRLLARIDDDPDWHPGKTYGGKVGRAKALSGTATANIARSAMSLKEAGREPTYRRVVSSCPKAVLNPATECTTSSGSSASMKRQSCCGNTDRAWPAAP